MGRSKTNIEFIAKDSNRRATFKKRKASVLKKASELSTLCGVKLCVIIYGCDEPRPEAWPSETDASELVHAFKNTPKNKEKSAKNTSPLEMLREKVVKAQEQIIKMELENQEMELAILMHEYITRIKSTNCANELGSEALRGIFWTAERRLRAVRARINALSSNKINAENAPDSNSVQQVMEIGVKPKEEKIDDIQEEIPLTL